MGDLNVITSPDLDEKSMNYMIDIVKEITRITVDGMKGYIALNRDNVRCETADYVENVARNFIINIIVNFTDTSDLNNYKDNSDHFLIMLKRSFDILLPEIIERERNRQQTKKEMH